MQSDRLNRGRACRGLLVLLMSACAALGMSAAVSDAYTFGPGAVQTGSEEMVFDWTTTSCEPNDIPDLPARAFRDADGLTQLIATHFVSRREIGFDLNRPIHNCSVLLQSDFNADPSTYDDKFWIASPYTLDGRTILALLHMEYQGFNHQGQCDPNYTYHWQCFYLSIGFGRSTDGGRTYVRTPPPTGVVASIPYTYAAMQGPQGIMQPSNVVYKADGYYYMVAGAYVWGAQQRGVCAMRTRTLSDPTSWRAWDGTGFNVRFIDPYVETTEPASAHVCTPVLQDENMSMSLTYNTYFGKYLLIGGSTQPDPTTGAAVDGVYYTLSSDLIHWGPMQLLMKATLAWKFTCADPAPIKDMSLLYPGSPARNFDITTQKAYLYFTRWNPTYTKWGCSIALDRDLIRIPIKFTAPRDPVSTPNCLAVKASPRLISLANNRWALVTLSDPAKKLTIEVKSVTQDEPTDGIPGARYGTRPNEVRVRAARSADGDGRVYRVVFIGTGGNATCWGVVKVGVPRTGNAVDTSDTTAISYDSLSPTDG